MFVHLGAIICHELSVFQHVRLKWIPLEATQDTARAATAHSPRAPPLAVFFLNVGKARHRTAQLLPHGVHVTRLQRPVDEGHRGQHLHSHCELRVGEAMLHRKGDQAKMSLDDLKHIQVTL